MAYQAAETDEDWSLVVGRGRGVRGVRVGARAALDDEGPVLVGFSGSGRVRHLCDVAKLAPGRFDFDANTSSPLNSFHGLLVVSNMYVEKAVAYLLGVLRARTDGQRQLQLALLASVLQR